MQKSYRFGLQKGQCILGKRYKLSALTMFSLESISPSEIFAGLTLITE